MVQSSRASDLFERIKTHANLEEFLENLVGKPDPIESEFLECKSGKSDDQSVIKNWRKALSGFANSDGGVLIWGIDEPKSGPKQIVPVPNVHELKQRLLELQRDATEPPVRDVEIEAFPSAPDNPAGLVVCLVPASRQKPHSTANHEYYFRAGNNFVPASHSLLKALFHPESVAQLEVYARICTEPDGPPGIKRIILNCWIHNAGPSSAYDVLLLYEIPMEIIPHHPMPAWCETATASPGMAIIANRPIHPTEKIQFLGVKVGHTREGNTQLLTGSPPLLLRFKIFSKHQPVVSCELIISEASIRAGDPLRATVLT